MIRRIVIFDRLFDARHGPIALKVLILLVVISVAAAAAGVFWRLSGLDDGRDRIAVAPPPSSSATSTDLPSILAWSPFGGAAATTQAAGGGLILKAIFLAVPAEASSAVIAVGEAPAVSVSPGQTLSTGAVVQSIHVDHVILQVGAQTERLDFPAPPALIDAAAPPATGLTIITPATPAPPPVVAGTAVNALQGAGVTSTDQGYRIGDAVPPPLLAAGLQPGDIITRVNNQTVAGNADPQAILNQAVQSGGARVDVIRSGRTITLSFPLR
ncbi:type II secretion system protein N [Brevundimonas sp.]|jgi:general secretion pathway protein C|uniref:type II secretion system protein N n=1 Tax=Brevundimonas sp. TaxID=1871086 RepID=UPI003783F535